MLGADKRRRNIVLDRQLSDAIDRQAKREARSASNLIGVVMRAYLGSIDNGGRKGTARKTIGAS